MSTLLLNRRAAAFSLGSVFCENRFYLGSFELTDLAGKGVDLVRFTFDDEGNDIDAPVTNGNALTSKNEIGILREQGVYARNARLVREKDDDGANPLLYRTTPLDQNQPSPALRKR
jgi:hypothetical protein